MTGEQRHTEHPSDGIDQPAPLSLADAYIAKVNAALGAGDDVLVAELADSYLDEALTDAGARPSAA
jgi:hypothetical protein